MNMQPRSGTLHHDLLPSYVPPGTSIVLVDVTTPERTTAKGDCHEEWRHCPFIASAGRPTFELGPCRLIGGRDAFAYRGLSVLLGEDLDAPWTVPTGGT